MMFVSTLCQAEGNVLAFQRDLSSLKQMIEAVGMSLRLTIYLAKAHCIWKTLQNPVYNAIEYDGFRNTSSLDNFMLVATQWINQLNTMTINQMKSLLAVSNVHNRLENKP